MTSSKGDITFSFQDIFGKIYAAFSWNVNVTHYQKGVSGEELWIFWGLFFSWKGMNEMDNAQKESHRYCFFLLTET